MLQSVIADLALQLFCQKKGRTFTLHELQTILRTIRKRQYESWSLEEIARVIIDSGILEVVAHETYGFRHQTFQEYLAAAELAQRLISQDQATREEAWIFAWNKRTHGLRNEIYLINELP